MGLLSPSLGLFFWHAAIFGATVLLLGKYAWEPVIDIIEEKEHSHQQAQHQAEQARKIVEALEKRNALLLETAEKKKERLITEGVAAKKALLAEAMEEAAQAKTNMLSHAHAEIAEERDRAREELKKDMGQLVVAAAERLLTHTLQTGKHQAELLRQILDEAEAATVSL